MYIHRIQVDEGDWIEGDVNITNIACDHFQHIFIREEKVILGNVLNSIPILIIEDQNKTHQAFPTMEEFREVVFATNSNATVGPNCKNGQFYQVCWNINNKDLLDVIYYFFCGHPMSKYFFYTCLVLLAKVAHPNKIFEFKPISLKKVITLLSQAMDNQVNQGS